MDKDVLIQKNNLEVNKLAAKCLRITLLFLISLWLFTMTYYYNCDKATVTMIFVGCVVLLLIPTALVNFINVEKQEIKYYIILCTLAVVFLLTAFVSYNFAVLAILPLLIATLYCDRKLIVITTVVDCTCVFGTMLMRYFLFRLGSEDGYKDFTEALVYGVFLKIVLILITTLVGYYMIDRNMVMLNKNSFNFK